MGASNALMAYRLYARQATGVPMQLLAYMALVSKDADADPWFGMGHQALALHALRRPEPIQEKDIKAVERGISRLLQIGAIVTDRPAAPRRDGPKTVRYRLQLRHGPAVVPRKPGDDASKERPPKSVQDVPRKTSERPPDTGKTSPGIRGTEEYEETGGAIGGRENLGRRPRQLSARAGASDGQEQSSTRTTIRPSGPACTSCGAELDPDGSCFICRTSPRRAVRTMV